MDMDVSLRPQGWWVQDSDALNMLPKILQVVDMLNGTEQPIGAAHQDDVDQLRWNMLTKIEFVLWSSGNAGTDIAYTCKHMQRFKQPGHDAAGTCVRCR